ncbi:MAG: ubiquitin-like protein Pup [candidate division NC10 bacterium]|nr:ubiquitin-like protein Pup [candidate division NC10 bacterium]
MPEQERRVQRTKEPAPEAKEAAASPHIVEKGKKLKEDLDKLLDEIDAVLEENAEEFVRNYVQRGGE